MFSVKKRDFLMANHANIKLSWNKDTFKKWCEERGFKKHESIDNCYYSTDGTHFTYDNGMINTLTADFIRAISRKNIVNKENKHDHI